MLKDNFNRRFTYLRFSVTEACNFRCRYCLPNGFTPPKEGLNELSFMEIQNLLSAFIDLGIKKIRITGGEPCLRKDITPIISYIKAFPQIERIALTSNGTGLNKNLDDYVKAGLSALNLSVDTLCPIKFKELTGTNKLPQILDIIDKAQSLALKAIKINAVLMKDVNDNELPSFLALLKNKPIAMRFIELMETQILEPDFLKPRQMLSQPLMEDLQQQGWVEIPKTAHSGPAREFKHKDYAGKIGFIAPYSKGFCENCNRLRISSQGQLQLCLFGQEQIDLRPFLQHKNQQEDLKNIILSSLSQKEKAHHLHEHNPGGRAHLASIGG